MPFEKQIMVIDDDDAIRALLVTVLSRRGFRVESARNGAEALQKLASSSLRSARARSDDAEDERIRTARADRSDDSFHTAAGAGVDRGNRAEEIRPICRDRTILKPFDLELLLNTIQGCLSATDSAGQIDPAELLLPPPMSRPEEAN